MVPVGRLGCRGPAALLRREFPLVEVDSSYYFPPARRTRSCGSSEPQDFTFNIKAFSLLTQHPTKPPALKGFLDIDGTRTCIRRTSSPTPWISVGTFLEALEPLRYAGKLGALLFQFPPWFTIGRKSRSTSSIAPSGPRPCRSRRVP